MNGRSFLPDIGFSFTWIRLSLKLGTRFVPGMALGTQQGLA
jgi:hypothetical protein